MSSFIEKILLIGFGAVICLALFSMISPLLEQLQIDNEKPNSNPDVINFYGLITQIKKNSKTIQQYPDNQFRIENNFSIANSIQFSMINNLTLCLELEFENQIFMEIIEFPAKFTLRKCGVQQEYQYYRLSRNVENLDSIGIILDLSQKNNVLWFEFS